MLYQAYQAFCDLTAPARAMADALVNLRDKAFGELGRADPDLRRFFALPEVFQASRITHKRPGYRIDEVPVGNAMMKLREEVVMSMPFGDLLHFAKDDVLAPQPKMLVVAPISGHFATLLRNTIEVLLRDHDVYVTDWKNARDVPLSAGDFGLDDYIDYVMAFIRELGDKETGRACNVLSVCQPCPNVLAAVAIMARDNDPFQPRTLTLLGGPIDVREAPTSVNELAYSKPYSWFERNMIHPVPGRYKGAGRKVYPGFMQLSAFMSMNLGRHIGQFRKLYQALADNKAAEAHKITEFYDEYLAVADLPGTFYLETIDRIFQRSLLPKGEFVHRGRRVDCGAIRKTALLTVEGEKDDICAVGQTAAAHLMCSSLRPHLKRHHLQLGVGHYGVFSGSKWETQVYPQVRSMVLAMA